MNAVEITSATGTLVPTWTTGDAITGGAGTDTLNITQTAAVTMPVGVTVSGVERINVMSATTATNINTTTFTGLETLNVTAPGTVTARAAATTAITVTDATLGGIVVTDGNTVNAFNNTVTVNGGSTVNVTTTEAVIATPGTAYSNTGTTQGVVNVGATAAAAGAVVINTTSTLADNAATGATTGTGTVVNVTGGTSITVNNTLATTGTSGDATDLLTGGAVNLIGNASTTAVSVTQTAARIRTADALGIANGSVIITDGDASKSAADSITSVTLANYGGVASAIESGALTTLNLSGPGSSLWINGLVAAANQTATTLNLNLNGLKSSGVVRLDAEGTGSSAYTTVNLNSSTSASTLANLQVGDVGTGGNYSAGTAKVTALNISGDAKLTLGDQTALTSTATITSTNTAGVTLTTALAVGQGFAGGDGADTITLTDELTKAITTGAGNDTVIIDDTATNAGKLTGTGGSVNAGDGKDTISLKASDAAVVSGNSTFNSKFTGFEAVILREPAGAQAVNLAGLNGANEVTTGAITIAGTTVGSLTIDSFTSGGKLTLTGNPAGTNAHAGTYTANVTNAQFATADVFNIALSSTAAFVRGANNNDLDTVVVNNVETVNITVNDASTDAKGSDAVVHNLGLTAAAATTITVSGNNGLNLTGTGTGALAAVTKFDASGVVANGNGTTGETDAASHLAVTFTSGNSTTTAAVSITGGAGADVLTGNAAIDTIVGGAGGDALSGAAGNDVISGDAGDDAITGNAGRDVLTGGAGADSFRYGARAENASATAANVDRITDFVAGTDKITIVVTGNGGAGDVLLGVNYDDTTLTNNTFATMGAAISSATTVASIEDVYVAMGVSLAALTGSGSTGALTVAQVINFANGAAAGSYLVINDSTAGFQAANDLVIDITGFTGTLASTDFSFI